MKQRVFKYDYLVRITLFGIILFAALNDVKGEEVGPADNNDGLLNVIRTEATQIEVFPLDYVMGGRSDWAMRYELTFERFQPIYRFKERACVATLAEVDECIARIDELTPKEEALVLAAICLFERTRRPCPSEFVIESGNDDDKRLTPYPNDSESEKQLQNWTTCFPIYRPDRSISKRTWLRLEKFVEKYCNSKEIAFSSIETNESELKIELTNSIKGCVELMKSKLDPTLPWDDWSELHFFDPLRVAIGGMTSSPLSLKSENSDDPLTLSFLEGVKSRETTDPTLTDETNELKMLREYWYAIRSRVTLLNDSVGPKMGNSSIESKTLGGVANQLLQWRIPYK
ncbi:MAG: hypothetical protein IJM54_06030 [Thermoguttaceae bacterium]|nr:hypothetical protein [Thermoguttaceae bacterium]